MITAEVLTHVRDMLAASGRMPVGFERIDVCRWGVVPAHVNEIHVPVEKPSAIVSPFGNHYAGEPETARIVLQYRVPLTGVPNVRQMRLGYDPAAELVVWSCE